MNILTRLLPRYFDSDIRNARRISIIKSWSEKISTGIDTGNLKLRSEDGKNIHQAIATNLNEIANADDTDYQRIHHAYKNIKTQLNALEKIDSRRIREINQLRIRGIHSLDGILSTLDSELASLRIIREQKSAVRREYSQEN